MSADTERVPHEPQLLTLPLLLHVYYNKQAQKRMTLQLARYEKCQKQEDCYNKHCTLNHPALHYRRKYIDGEFKELINTVTGAMVSQYGKKGRNRKDLQWLFPTADEQMAIDMHLVTHAESYQQQGTHLAYCEYHAAHTVYLLTLH
jgi:hypothetical protein